MLTMRSRCLLLLALLQVLLFSIKITMDTFFAFWRMRFRRRALWASRLGVHKMNRAPMNFRRRINRTARLRWFALALAAEEARVTRPSRVSNRLPLRPLQSRPGRSNSSYSAKVISYEDVKKLVAEGEAKVFDVRSPEEVANGRIANSVNIPVAEVEEAFKMDPETFKMKYGVNKPRRDEENLVFHCQMGKRGARATEIAVALGYVKARNYAGGYKEWSEKEGK